MLLGGAGTDAYLKILSQTVFQILWYLSLKETVCLSDKDIV